MRKRKWQLALLAATALALLFGVLYEASTHVVCGWLRGEAFYDGRPTSYWRAHIDGWVSRFDSPDAAVTHLRAMSSISSSIPFPPPPTFWGRMCNTLHLPVPRSDTEPPGILTAFADAEAVWRELEDDAACERIVKVARRNAELNEWTRVLRR